MSDVARTDARDDGSSGRERLLTIGQVVRILQQEFPGLSISKVRYLEDRGLLAPQRTPGRYRKYDQSDIRRLRTILTLQRDEFLPLEVIRERMHRGTAAGTVRTLAPAVSLKAPGSLRREETEFTWEEALEAAGISESFMRQLMEYRLVDADSTQPDAKVSASDVEVARTCDLLARFGLEPRNLRLLRSSVEREIALVEQLCAPVLRSPHAERREQGEKMLQDLGSLLSHLSDILLYKELRRLLE